MLKVIHANLYQLGQSFLDELENVDWGDNPPDFPPDPRGNQGVITEDNYEQYEPTAIEEPIEEHVQRTVEPTSEEPAIQMPEFQDEGEHPENAVEYGSGQQLVYDGIDNYEVIAFDYTNRHGQYAGTRRVEPHYTFVASTTGNEVLVSFDHTRGDIRAFIVGNIHPYGVRYEGETFEPRGEIMRGVY